MKRPINDAVAIGIIEDDLRRIRTVSRKINGRLKLLAQTSVSHVERDVILESIAFQVQAFYTGTEALLEKCLAAKGVRIPSSASHHSEIINQADDHKLIPPGTLDYIRDLTRFRHYARHGYGHDIQENLLLPKAAEVGGFQKKLRGTIILFVAELRDALQA